MTSEAGNGVFDPESAKRFREIVAPSDSPEVVFQRLFAQQFIKCAGFFSRGLASGGNGKHADGC